MPGLATQSLYKTATTLRRELGIQLHFTNPSMQIFNF